MSENQKLDEQPAEVIEEIPEAETESPDDDIDKEPLLLKAPFAIVNSATLMPRGDKSPGSYAVIRCSCGQPFKLDLLDNAYKVCPNPNCNVSYSHALLIAPEDDEDIVDDTILHLYMENGMPTGDGSAEDEEEEEEETEETSDE